jgi:hypothetical protein
MIGDILLREDTIRELLPEDSMHAFAGKVALVASANQD